MQIFTTLLLQLIPLYLMILLGLIAVKKLQVQKEGVAKLLIYIIVPPVIFSGAYTAQINLALIALPITIFLTACTISLSFFALGKLIFKTDSTKNLLAYTSGTCNAGYFGLPVALIVFGDQIFSLVVIVILSLLLYENTLGFFLTAKGSHSAKESLIKIIKLPAIYAFTLGLIFNYFQIPLAATFTTTIETVKAAYVPIGMMMLGMGLSATSLRHFDLKFLSLSFLAKFLVWPLAILAITTIDKTFFQAFDSQIHGLLLLMSVNPLAVSTVIYATELKVHPDKAALAVLLSTLFALIYIPLIVALFIS